MIIGGAAAEIGRKAVYVGIRFVVIPLVLAHAGPQLVGLLIVLMGRHFRVEGRGQGVEGQLFQNIRQIVSEGAHADEGFQRIHGLHHGAQLSALGGVGAVQVLVAGEQPVAHAVIFHQFGPAHAEPGLLLKSAFEQAYHAGGLQAHGDVHAVGQVILGVEIGPLVPFQNFVAFLLQGLLQPLPA